jgi:4a-hydroxytetrahydrobiopterin dehydratase
MPGAPKLSDIEVQRELGTLAGWARKGESLVKTFSFPTFMAGIVFVDRVAVAAEKMDHHPDLDIRYTKISVTLSTHSAGGITGNDVALAREMEKL